MITVFVTIILLQGCLSRNIKDISPLKSIPDAMIPVIFISTTKEDFTFREKLFMGPLFFKT